MVAHEHDAAPASIDRGRQAIPAAPASTARRTREKLAGIVAAVRAAAACERCTIQLVEGDELVVTATDPPLVLGPRARRRPVDAGVAGRVATTRAPVYLADLAAEGTEPAAEGLTARARTYYGVPLQRGGELLGILQVDATEGDALDAGSRRRIDAIARDLSAELSPETDRGGDAPDVLAHEIRRPLTSLRGLSDTLAERADRLDRETVRTIARRLRAASLRLEGMVQDLLDLARTGEMRLEVRPRRFDLAPLLAELAADRAERPLTLSVEPGLRPVLADASRLRQILENLLENAERFSPEGSPIELTASGEGAVVAVSVRDRGEGIPARELDRIFERFHQVDPGHARGGLGIGLALVREIAAAMGVRVRVSSRLGHGSVFTLEIPLADPL